MVTATAEPQTKEIDLTRLKCVIPTGATQEDFVFDRHKYVLWIGGRGCAKTASGIFKLMEYMHTPEHAGAAILATAPTWRQLQAVTIRTFDRWVPKEWIRKKHFSGDKMWVDMTNGCTVFFCNASNPDSVRGMEVAVIWADEIADCDRDFLDVVMPCLRQPGYPHQVILTGTPKGRNWLYQMFIDPQSRLPFINGKEQVSLYRARSYDNPFLGRDYTATLESQYSGNRAMYDQEVMGDFVRYEGLVYPAFDYGTHVKPLPANVHFKRVVGGVDFGLTEPTAALLIGQDESGRYWEFKEFFQRRANLGEFLATLAKWRDEYHVQRYFCDPHGDREIQTLVANGIPAVKGDARSLETRVRVVNNLLEVKAGGPGLMTTSNCVNLITEKQSYSHAGSGKDDKFSDTIKKKQSDHMVDCEGYAILGIMSSQPRHNIKQIIFG